MNRQQHARLRTYATITKILTSSATTMARVIQVEVEGGDLREGGNYQYAGGYFMELERKLEEALDGIRDCRRSIEDG